MNAYTDTSSSQVLTDALEEAPRTRDFLLEIGCEELPSTPLLRAEEQLKKLSFDSLKASGLAFSSLEVYSSPRRLALVVKDLAASTKEKHEVLRGPSAAIAFDEEGKATKAALGFARGAQVSAEELFVRKDKDGRDYVFCEKNSPAIPAQEILQKLCLEWIKGLNFPRSQRWGSTQERFLRPVRWLVALFGSELVPFSFADVRTGTTTRGHRVLAPGEHGLRSASEYVSTLRSIYVLLREERKERILSQIAKLQHARPGSRIDLPKKTFEEVVNLCEWPQALVGRFDEDFLKVPHEIICESMLSNQRYFPIYTADGELSCEFVVVSNADPNCAQTVIDGNERVVRARLDDAQFFYEEDLKVGLDSFFDRLSRVAFQEKLGSVQKKVLRIEKLMALLVRQAGCDALEASAAFSAAHLCKCDLVSQSVVEFTNQQGTIGGYFAEAAGYSAEIAQAIKEHYKPRFAHDSLPQNRIGKLLALADKLDTIAGMFAIDEQPSGSSDPYAQRRSAIGCIEILRQLPKLSLKPLLEVALDAYEEQDLRFDRQKTYEALLDFFAGRLSSMAKDDGHRADSILALSATKVVDPCVFFARLKALDTARSQQEETFDKLALAYTRALKVSDFSLGTEPKSDCMNSEELALLSQIKDAEGFVACRLSETDPEKQELVFAEILEKLASLKDPVDDFFENVLVMDPDPELRANRQTLLNRFVGLFQKLANFSLLAKDKKKDKKRS